MRPKGLKTLSKHLLEFNSPTQSARIIIAGPGLFILTIYFYTLVNRFLTIWGPDGQIIITTIGFLLMRLFFTSKNTYIARYGDRAYRYAFLRFALPGLALIFASVAYISYIPGPRIPISLWAIVTPYLGWYSIIIGSTFWIRAIFVFGFDNLAMLYVYFPEEGNRVNSSIYEIIRHPVYAGVIRLGIGLALINGNIFAVIFGLLVLPFGLFAWVRLVEERELIERFGKGYIDYRKTTPAFWPRLRNLPKFYQFLIKWI